MKPRKDVVFMNARQKGMKIRQLERLRRGKKFLFYIYSKNAILAAKLEGEENERELTYVR